MSELPVDVTFDIPEGWVPINDEDADVVLAKSGEFPWFRPNITIQSAELAPDKTLTDLAEHLVEELRPKTTKLEVAHRQQHGTPEAPTMFQALRLQIQVEGQLLDLLQTSSLVELIDQVSGRHWASWSTLTVLPEDGPKVSADFEAFVASCRFSYPQESGRGDRI